MNNIQKAGQYLMYIFYTLLIGLVASVIYYFTIKGVYNDIFYRSSVSDNDFNLFSFISFSKHNEINTYTDIYKIVMVICLFLFFVFLYRASRNLMYTEDSNEDEILTSGERMKRMMENSDENSL